mmetsp:Transcript_4296/g.13406  ORF Transcript_4296/g.13406 Transcript_4296/m.13406 type:complete len:205 (+) Transcript_4296:669-1283(+)
MEGFELREVRDGLRDAAGEAVGAQVEVLEARGRRKEAGLELAVQLVRGQVESFESLQTSQSGRHGPDELIVMQQEFAQVRERAQTRRDLSSQGIGKEREAHHSAGLGRDAEPGAHVDVRVRPALAPFPRRPVRRLEQVLQHAPRGRRPDPARQLLPGLPTAHSSQHVVRLQKEAFPLLRHRRHHHRFRRRFAHSRARQRRARRL